MNKIVKGNVLRNRAPYWGEAAMRITDAVPDKYNMIQAVCLGGKFGPAGVYPANTAVYLLSVEDLQSLYKPCNRIMRAWLWFLGKTIGIYHYNKKVK